MKNYKLIKENPDAVAGGLSDKLSVADIAKKHNVPVSKIKDQIKMGVKVEMEHTNDATLAAEIARDHLTEDPEYYTKLKSIEAGGGAKMERLKELIRQEIRNQQSMNEATYVMHYGQGQNRFVHQLKAFSLKNALEQFIDMYKIPKDKWKDISVRKSGMF
jgi:predicted DNA-binding protein YlxM (UPF0122 family)